MTICDLALYSTETSSGVRTYIENKIRYVDKRPDVSKHIVIVPGTEDRVTTQGRTKIIMVRGVPSFYPGLSIGISIGKIADIVEKEAPDLIEVNCQYTLPWAAFLATRRRRIPIVGVYHTDVPACARHTMDRAGLPFGELVEKLVDFYVGVVYRHFTRTIVLNDGVVQRLKRLGVQRIQRLPCGVDIEIFRPERFDPDFRKRLSILPGQKIVLYVGRLSAEKEMDLLLVAYRKLSPGQFVLLIAGDGPDRSAIEALAKSESGVKYLGHFDSRYELAGVYASSDVFVIPSRHETFGMAALEALACGVPVVAIDGSGAAALVGKDVGMLALAGDSTDMAGKIALVSNWPRNEVREVCRTFASNSYSWDAVFEQYFNIYQELIETGVPSKAVL